MSRLRELIDELCPDGVEYKPIKCVATIRNGRDHKSLSDGLIPVYGSGGIMRYVDTSSYDKPSVLIPRKGSLANVFYVDEPFWNVDTIFHTVINEAMVLPKYFYYAICFTHVEQYGTEGARPSLTQAVLNEVKVPVPPIEVQHEIVRILDSFQELDDALTVEIEAREKQFEASLSTLMENLAKDAPAVKLGSQMTIVRGASPRPIKSYLTSSDDGVHWIKIGDVGVGGKLVTNTAEYVTPAGAAKSRFLKRGSLILSNSMSFGRPYILDIDGCIHDGWLAMSDYESSYDRDFLYYLLRSKGVQTAWDMAASTSTVRNLNADIVRDTSVPLPSMDKQLELVGVLDKIMSLSNTLRSERDARRKQFAYYRDKLLSFPEKAR